MGGDSQRTLFDNGPPARPTALPPRYARPGKRPAKARATDSLKPLPEPVPTPTPSDTRKEALSRIAPVVNTLQRKVLQFFISRRDQGATDGELVEALGMVCDTVRPRRNELVALGLLVDSGRRRSTMSGRAAVVWVIAPSFSHLAPPAPASASEPSDAPPDAPPKAVSQKADPPSARHRPGLGRGPIRPKDKPAPCSWCGSTDLWESVHDVLICTHCHPPPTEALVKRRIKVEE